MSDLGRCPECRNQCKWGREVDPKCPNCGAIYEPLKNPALRKRPSLYCDDCREGPFQSKRGVSIHKRVHLNSAGGENPD